MVRIFFILSAVVLLAVACVFAFSGSGNYEYEGTTEEVQGAPEVMQSYMPPDIIEIIPYTGEEADEDIDDEFDLLDDGDLDWHWFERLECFVLMDYEGELHYGSR